MKTQLFTKLLTTATVAAAALSLSAPAHAFSFGTGGIKFENNTKVNFNFEGSNGAYQSTLKIFKVLSSGSLLDVTGSDGLFKEVKASDNGSKNGWIGSCGKAVLLCSNSFTFEKDTMYTFGLSSIYNGKDAGTVYSTSSLNKKSKGSQQAVFGEFGHTTVDGKKFNAAPYQSGNPFGGPLKIAFDDRGNGNDMDYNDFRFTAKAVPEPSATLAMFAVGTIGLLKLRRRNTEIG